MGCAGAVEALGGLGIGGFFAGASRVGVITGVLGVVLTVLAVLAAATR